MNNTSRKMQMLYEQTLIVKRVRYLPKFRKAIWAKGSNVYAKHQKKAHFTAIRKLMHYEFMTTLYGEKERKFQERKNESTSIV